VFSLVQTPEIADPQLRHQLDSLKKEDKLSDWIYTRIDHSNLNRRKHLTFLMNSEKEAWRKASAIDEKEAWLMLLSNQGYNQLFSGNVLASINSYEQAYNFWSEHNLNIDITDYVLKPWANDYTRLGDYERALFIQQKILDFSVREKDRLLAASTYNNMAISYRSLGNQKKAMECIQLGFAQAGQDAHLKILLGNTQADIYKDLGQLKAAEEVISINILVQRKLAQDLQTAYWLLSSYITAGDVQFAKGQYQQAQNYYRLAVQINEQYYKGNRLREQAYILTQIGKICLKQGFAAEAIGHFNNTLNTLGILDKKLLLNRSKIYGDNRLVDVFYQKALASLDLGKGEQALENIRLSLFAADQIRLELADVKTRQRFQAESRNMAEKAIAIAFDLLQRSGKQQYAEIITDIIEKAKARSLLDDIRRNQQQLTLQTKDTLFSVKQSLERAIAYNESQLLREPEEINSLTKHSAELQFKLEAVEKKLRNKYPAMKASTLNEEGVAELFRKLPAGQQLIEFFIGSDDLYAIELSRQGVKHIRRVRNAGLIRQEISDFVNRYYQHGPATMTNNPKAYFKSSYNLYQLLLGSFHIRKSDRLIIIPDEVLGYLSFDGLVTNNRYTAAISGWPFLIKKASIAYAFSIRTLLQQSDQNTPSAQGFSGLFITHQHKGKQSIPAVAKEAAALKNLVSGDFLMDAKATAGQFFQSFEQSSVLHISTHSYLSGIQQEPTLAFEDKPVFLFELSARKSAPDLVVLSACRTADGMMAEGEGIISLSRGFAAIGTKGTIAGLWNVNDEAAATITSESYKNLIKGESVSEALRHAKLSWLSGGRNAEQEYLPYYWDALIYMGHDQRIALKAAILWQDWIIPSGIVILVLLAIFLALKRWRLKVAR